MTVSPVRIVRTKNGFSIRPVTEEETQRLRGAEIEKQLAEMKAIAQEVAAAWTSDKSGVELVR